MRCARSSEVGVLLGLLPLLVCASFDVLARAQRRCINVMGCWSCPDGLVRWQGVRQVGAISGGSRRQWKLSAHKFVKLGQ